MPNARPLEDAAAPALHLVTGGGVPLAGRALQRALAPLVDRRSAQLLTEPGPDPEQLAALVGAACTVPDHGALRPYRFVVARGGARELLGDALAAAVLERDPGAPAGMLDKVRGKARLAPVMVVLVARPAAGHKVPEWEQVVTAGCAGYALTLAAHLAGFGAVWKSSGVMAGGELTRMLSLQPGEHLLGWVNIGTRTGAEPVARPSADPAQVATLLSV